MEFFNFKPNIIPFLIKNYHMVFICTLDWLRRLLDPNMCYIYCADLIQLKLMTPITFLSIHDQPCLILSHSMNYSFPRLTFKGQLVSSLYFWSQLYRIEYTHVSTDELERIIDFKVKWVTLKRFIDSNIFSFCPTCHSYLSYKTM